MFGFGAGAGKFTAWGADDRGHGHQPGAGARGGAELTVGQRKAAAAALSQAHAALLASLAPTSSKFAERGQRVIDCLRRVYGRGSVPTVLRRWRRYFATAWLRDRTDRSDRASLDWLAARANAGYVSGRYDVDGMTLYVNNGTALWPGFALRLGRPSELTRITLRTTRHLNDGDGRADSQKVSVEGAKVRQIGVAQSVKTVCDGSRFIVKVSLSTAAVNLRRYRLARSVSSANANIGVPAPSVDQRGSNQLRAPTVRCPVGQLTPRSERVRGCRQPNPAAA